MVEFLEDVVKLFIDVEEDRPLPLRYKIIAIVFIAGVTGALAYFLRG